MNPTRPTHAGLYGNVTVKCPECQAERLIYGKSNDAGDNQLCFDVAWAEPQERYCDEHRELTLRSVHTVYGEVDELEYDGED